ncbi:MAG: hypothetical protein HY344_02280 [Candidatus Levybacteria bacterium]|nr:hypothetical protein [Candidatus Levybacteria bacterium]
MKRIILPGFIAGVCMLIVSLLCGYVSNTFIPGLAKEYENVHLFRPWTDPLMLIYFANPFVFGFFLAIAWDYIKVLFKDDRSLRRGFAFGLVFFPYRNYSRNDNFI